MSLPHDYARCTGRDSDESGSVTCPHRLDCERYRDWHSGDMGPRTPVIQRMCQGKEYRIPVNDQATQDH